MADDSGFLLQYTDETVAIVQKLVTDLHADIEQNMETNEKKLQFGALNRDAVELTSHMLSERLAKLWPCEKKYVAVIGPTGAGKSTLLNSIVSMTCRTGKAYTDGIEHGSERAALRETARHYFRSGDDVIDVDMERAGESHANPDSASVVSEEERGNQVPDAVVPADIAAERKSICGLLGMCCAQNKEAYLSRHLPVQDRCPFLLFTGRMGGAGTTKVTAVQWGPQFACHLRWVEKKKIRKRCRELRKWKTDPNSSQIEESRINEYKALWERMLFLVDHPFRSGQVPFPTEALIESTITKLAKKVPLGKIETIQTQTTKGSVLDRLQVRSGIRNRLFEQQLGLLAEELIIEAPIPSSEGGVSLLDVPGTNDPRVLHQRETRDAIDRTALILLIVDKSVLDEDTVRFLYDSPILERMLLDDSANCSLVVVGIAQKGSHPNQSPCESIAKFDPNQNLMKTLRKTLLLTAKRLSKSRLLDIDVGKQRVARIFEGDQFCVLPVLPLLCASLQLSRSNTKLHEEVCESYGSHTCPLVMSEKELRKRCLETNIPQLLERIHAVRMPPAREDLLSLLTSTKALLENLTQVSTYDVSMVEFLKRELKHAKTESSKALLIDKFIPKGTLDLAWIREVLHASAEGCQMSSQEVVRVSVELGNKAAIRAVNNWKLLRLAPDIMHGFRSELIGKIARKLIRPTEEKAAEFVNCICKHMVTSLQGSHIWRETTVDKVSSESLGSCTTLIAEVEKAWKQNLDRIRGRWLCGDKGLLKNVRDTLSKSFDKSMKYLLKELRMKGNDAAIKQRSLQLLKQNEAGKQLQDLAGKEIEVCIQNFWDAAKEIFQKETSKMWTSWQQQLVLLKTSIEEALVKEKVADEEGIQKHASVQKHEETVMQNLQGNIIAIEHLQQRLVMHSVSGEKVNYGYSLLQKSPKFEGELMAYKTTGLQPDYEGPQGQPCRDEPNLAPGSTRNDFNDRSLGDLRQRQSAGQGSNQLLGSPTGQGSKSSNRFMNPATPRKHTLQALDEKESQEQLEKTESQKRLRLQKTDSLTKNYSKRQKS